MLNQKIPYLVDRSKQLIYLFNVKLAPDHLSCGLAIFRGGLSGVKSVFFNDTEITIQIPEEVAQSATYISFVNEKNELIFYYAQT